MSTRGKDSLTSKSMFSVVMQAFPWQHLQNKGNFRQQLFSFAGLKKKKLHCWKKCVGRRSQFGRVRRSSFVLCSVRVSSFVAVVTLFWLTKAVPSQQTKICAPDFSDTLMLRHSEIFLFLSVIVTQKKKNTKKSLVTVRRKQVLWCVFHDDLGSKQKRRMGSRFSCLLNV